MFQNMDMKDLVALLRHSQQFLRGIADRRIIKDGVDIFSGNSTMTVCVTDGEQKSLLFPL